MKNPTKISWYELSSNSNIKAIEVLKENPDKICWYQFSLNQNLNLMEEEFLYENRNKLNMCLLYENPCIFKYDYKKMKETYMNGIGYDIILEALHPDRIFKDKNYYNSYF